MRNALQELRVVLNTPMKRFDMMDLDAQSTCSSSTTQEGSDDSIADGDLPAQIMRLVGRRECSKACTVRSRLYSDV